MLNNVIVLLYFIVGVFSSVSETGGYDDRPFDLNLYEDVLDPVVCQQQLANMRAFEFYDASFRIPQGILKGNFVSMGSYHQCLGIKQDAEDVPIEGKYCMVQSFIWNPIPSLSATSWTENKEWMTLSTNATSKKLDDYKNSLSIGNKLIDQNRMYSFSVYLFSLALCIPKTCTVDEALAPIIDNGVFEFIHDVEFCRLPNDKPLVAADYTAFTVLSVLALLTVLSTVYDVQHIFIFKKDPAQINKLFQCCSLYTNTKALLTFKNNPGSIDCLDGMRALSIAWVIVGHSFLNYLSKYTANVLDIFDWLELKRNMWLLSADLSVDTFLVLSGLLLVFTSANKIKQMQLLKNLHFFYLHRLLRMFPLLALVVLLQASIFNHVSDGVDWHVVAHNVQKCRDYWWSALLHIQNIVNPESYCLPQTWYLSVDVQLHILSPLILFWVLGSQRSARIGLAFGICATLIASTIYIFVKDFTAVNRDVYYYKNTLTRSPPFIIGMIFGYILHVNRGNKLRISKGIVAIAYAVSGGVSFYCVYCVFIESDSVVYHNLNLSFVRPCWGLCVCWLIFACVNGYGGPINWFLSLNIWKFPSRISYALYLFHWPILFVMRGSSVTSFYFSMENMWVVVASVMVYTVIASTAACALVDAPFSILQKILLGNELNKDGKRPDGATLVPWCLGRALVWDATCVDTLAPSHVKNTARRAGAAAEQAQILKSRKYSQLCADYEFVVLAVETLGPWSSQIKMFYHELSARLFHATGDLRAGSYFAHGNAASILGSMPRAFDGLF